MAVALVLSIIKPEPVVRDCVILREFGSWLLSSILQDKPLKGGTFKAIVWSTLDTAMLTHSLSLSNKIPIPFSGPVAGSKGQKEPCQHRTQFFTTVSTSWCFSHMSHS